MNAIVLRGLARLATEAVAGTSHVVEAVQHEILERLPLPARIAPRVVGGIAGLTHRGVRGIARSVGAGLDRALDVAAPRLARGPETEVAIRSRSRCASGSATRRWNRIPRRSPPPARRRPACC